MKPISTSLLVLLLFLFTSCSENSTSTETQPPANITSAEYIDGLLFVPSGDFQIKTDQEATFTSANSLIKMSPSGVITRITSGEIVPIDITWTKSGTQTRIYAIGATDNAHDQPYARYHDVADLDPYSSYVKGWKTLQKLAGSTDSYGIILRHGDAHHGRDFSFNPANANKIAPAEWWKSTDSTLARQLNAQGQQRSSELGVIFKDLGLPVARVYSSEFYRSLRTAQLMNLGLPIVTDGRINHPAYNMSGASLFEGMLGVMGAQPVDGKITLVVTHHPINEPGGKGNETFPKAASVFNWTGAYFVKVDTNKKITYEGAASWGMFKYWRDLKLNRL